MAARKRAPADDQNPANEQGPSEDTASADERAPAGHVAPADDLAVKLARALFRADKWDPVRDQSALFQWEDHHTTYRARARRLLRTFEKDGLALSIAPGAPATEC